MNATGYCRVSTERQVDEGVSLSAQRARIVAWCMAGGHDAPHIEADEGLSGKRADNRPALQRALDRVCAARGVLVVYSLSRLCRSTRDALDIAERLKKAGAHLVSLTEAIDTTTAMGAFFFTVMAALGELERRLIGDRTREALAHKRARGEKTGGKHAPYGYREVDGKLLSSAVEMNAIRDMSSLRSRGDSYAAIAGTLNARSVPTRTGAPWSAKVVRGVFLRSETA